MVRVAITMKDISARVVFAAAGLALLGVGCSDGTHFPAPVGVDTGVGERSVSDANFRDGSSADSPVEVRAEGPGGDSGLDAPAPSISVKIIISKPTSGAVVPALMRFTPEVEVRVEGRGGRTEDTLKSLVAGVVDADGKKLVERPLNQVGLEALPESGAVTYRFADTPLDLAGALSGQYKLELTATMSDGAEVKETGLFLIDGGPVIRIDSPIMDKSYRGSAPIDVTIADMLFGPVSDVQMKIGQTILTFTGPGGAAGTQYTTTLDFAAFMPPLEGEQILTVRAKNKNGTEAVLTRKFVSDSQGPLIAMATPKDGDLVGNVITISAEVTDPAGVLSSSVLAVFANGPGTEYTVPLVPPPAGSAKPLYTAIFDTRLLPFGENALFPTLSFRASDNLGNESLISSVVWLDNRPPLSDLDPPDMRIRYRNEASMLTCGWPFDPVGPDSADDMDIVPQVVDIRARVEDRGNEVLSGSPNYIPISGVATTQLLVLDDTSQPLLVNTNPVARGPRKADTLCDAINPLLVPTTRPMTAKDALLITMTAIPAVGLPDQTNTPGPGVTMVGDDDYCLPHGGNSRSPEPACNVAFNPAKAKYRITQAGMISLVTRHTDSAGVFLGYAGGTTGMLPSIWTIPKHEAGMANPLCGGTQLDTLANFLSDGWACLAVLATDKLGNKQVSAPLRICVDKNVDGQDCPHKAIANVIDATPLTVITTAAHGYATGERVKVSGIDMATRVNGLWTITVTGPTSFTLDGSVAQAPANVFPTTWTRTTGTGFHPGHVVRVADVPNCTGTQTADPPMTTVTPTACQPWMSYSVGESRQYQ